MSEKNRKRLYPFKFVPTEFEKPWGTEKWTVADLGFADSEISEGWLAGNTMSDLMETYLERVTGESVYQGYGRQFPVFVKFADIHGRMPLTVHPDDSVAVQRYDALGKAKLWYVQDAAPDARLYIGFKRQVSASEFYEKCLDGTVYGLMNEVVPAKGSHWFIAPGTVHAAIGKVKLACICESSDADFILHNPYDTQEDSDTRMLHISESLDFVNLDKSAIEEGRIDCAPDAAESTIVLRKEFNAAQFNLSAPLHIFTEKYGSYIVYACVAGEVAVQVQGEDGNMENYVVPEGEAVLIPAEVPDFFLVPRDRDTVLLEVVTLPSDDLDDYIDPNTEPFLEGEDYGGLDDGDGGLDDEVPDDEEN